ncbi:hypothetical protein AAG570_012177 [Ranatra chinensis]|uniref:Uncharacterized protein n=1 Tax=Ranatra chinensis TaxID=642074 RepID=A0ABD0YI15_9HEMI
MEAPVDPRPEFLGNCVQKAMKLKPEKWTRLMATKDLKAIVMEFLDTGNSSLLIISQNTAAQLIPATSFPVALKNKGVYFVKVNKGPVPKTELNQNLIYGDMATKPIEQMAALVDESSERVPNDSIVHVRPKTLDMVSGRDQNVLKLNGRTELVDTDSIAYTKNGGRRDGPEGIQDGKSPSGDTFRLELNIDAIGNGTTLRDHVAIVSSASEGAPGEGTAKIFVPLLSNTSNHKRWPPSVADDVKQHVHTLKNTVYQVRGYAAGKTVLPMPIGVGKVHNVAAKLLEGGELPDFQLKSAIEGVVIKWAEQINDVLSEDSTKVFANGQNPTPSAEHL